MISAKNIKSPQECAIVCDNKGAIKKVFLTTLQYLKPTTDYADIISACLKLIEKIPISLIPHHVKAHQDDHKEFHKPSEWEKLNVIMDKKAKSALTQLITSKEDTTEFPAHLWSIPVIRHDTATICFNFCKNLYQSIYEKKIINYWTSHDRFSQDMHRSIDWEAHN